MPAVPPVIPPVTRTVAPSVVGARSVPSTPAPTSVAGRGVRPTAPVWDAPAAPDHVGGDRSWSLLHTDLALDDVHGLRRTKRRLAAALRRADRVTAGGRAAGLMLYGPQGCGRSLLVRAVAGDAGGALIRLRVPELVARAARTADPGESVQLELTAMFVAARRLTSCVIVLDDLDALAPGDDAHELVWAAADAVVARLCTELDGRADGRESRNGRVLLIGSSDRPWCVPAALRGNDRLGPEVLVDAPDRPARRALLERRLTGPAVGVLNLPRLVCSTNGLSAAELVWVCTRARALAAWDDLTGRGPGLVGMAELAAAISEVRPGARMWCAERLAASRRRRTAASLPVATAPART